MSLLISRVLHAGFIFESNGTKIIFDPIFEAPFSRNCFPYPAVEFDLDQIRSTHFDAVFISHYHDDHCSLDSLDLINRQTPIFIYCTFPAMAELLVDLGFTNVRSLSIDAPVNVGSFIVTPRPAMDENVDALFQIQADGFNLLNVVDAWIDDNTIGQLASLGPWDVIFWPFQTLRESAVLSPHRAEPAPTHLPSDWTDQLRRLSPRVLVPGACQFIHESWSWYNRALFPVTYSQFENELGSVLANCKIVRMNPSKSFILDGTSFYDGEALPWVKPIGPQMVDYSYLGDLAAPSTSEVSIHLPALTPEQTELCLTYCRMGLSQRYRDLSDTTPEYFNVQRRWRLSLFNENGLSKNFTFNVNRASCTLDSRADIQDGLSWTTQLPIYKLHSALTTGESLTSMYVRINDQEFSESVERDLAEVELTDDPLIRCLFNGTPESYQREQLKRIKAKMQLDKSRA